ncbi:MAG: SDR family oxidoreductase [Gammaproteobacteria bacterium]|nr:SDR family oxidoreductase [Gammaproteobacteria bacterium]
MRLKDQVCVLVGAGQTPGETIGNGRAAAITYAREGARLLLVDIDAARVAETQSMIAEEGFNAEVMTADVKREDDCRAIMTTAVERLGRIDVLHYNVGKSQGDSEVTELGRENWTDIMEMNLTGFYLCCKHALPIMREQHSGVITAISSMAAHGAHMNMTYGVSKSGMNSLVKSMAIHNAGYGIRINSIMPGLMDTPMAIERRASEQNRSRDEIRGDRARQVPLLGQQGTGWDVANAALFLASCEAGYITGICLPVDGGLSAQGELRG